FPRRSGSFHPSTPERGPPRRCPRDLAQRLFPRPLERRVYRRPDADHRSPGGRHPGREMKATGARRPRRHEKKADVRMMLATGKSKSESLDFAGTPSALRTVVMVE